MQGICATCGNKTSLPRVTRCRKCYYEQTQGEYNKTKRDNDILILISSGQYTAAEAAKKYQLSREAVRLILMKNGLKYRDIKESIRSNRLVEKKKEVNNKSLRVCKVCKKIFTKTKDHPWYVYCSQKCHDEKAAEMQRARTRKYYYKTKKLLPVTEK